MPKKSKLTQQADEVAAEAGEQIDRQRRREQAAEDRALSERMTQNALKRALQHRGK